MVLQVDLDYSLYSGFCNNLKNKRDSIAHGEQTGISIIDDCMIWHEPAIKLLDVLVDETINMASNHFKS